MGGKMSRRKGYNGENNLVKMLRPYVEALRVPLSGGGWLKGDIIVQPGDKQIKLEVKNQESISNKMWEWLSGVEGLVIKKNNRPYLLVVNLEELLKNA